MSDRYGRKWPLVINLLIVAVLELGSGFVQTFEQFLAVRSLFGIGMGGIWGLAASTSLENLPVEVRGLASGVLQQGYAVGYLLAAVINLTLVPETSASWRALFFTSAGLSAFSAGIRCLLPESAIFIRAKEHARASGFTTKEKTKIFLRETKEMLKKHWMLCIYAVLLMTGEFSLDKCTILAHLDDRLQLPIPRLPGPVPDVHAERQGLQCSRRNDRDHHRKLRTLYSFRRRFPSNLHDFRVPSRK